jgi:hypothetical protein
MELIGILLAKLAAPFADGFIRDDHAAVKQQLFHITKAQAETEIQSHRVADDLCRKTMVLVASASGYGTHAATVSYKLEVEQVVNACRRKMRRAHRSF